MIFKNYGFVLFFFVMAVPEILCSQPKPYKKLEKLLQMFEGRAKSRVLEKFANSIDHNAFQSEAEGKIHLMAIVVLAEIMAFGFFFYVEKLASREGIFDLTFEEVIEILSIALEIFFHYDVEHTLGEIKETIEDVGKEIVEASEKHNEQREPKEHNTPHIYPSTMTTIEPYLYITTDFPLEPFGHQITDAPIQHHVRTITPSAAQQYAYTYTPPNLYARKWMIPLEVSYSKHPFFPLDFVAQL